jgi:hypothetical protein
MTLLANQAGMLPDIFPGLINNYRFLKIDLGNSSAIKIPVLKVLAYGRDLLPTIKLIPDNMVAKNQGGITKSILAKAKILQNCPSIKLK